ncbi:MAG: site-specific DNA-methyltransferase [Christensenellales bacterium]|jgi:adenine-specific DNA-methyltransferase
MTHMDGKGMNILEENIKHLKELFPEIVTEGKVDFDMLRQVLGDYVEEDKEAYSFTWSGKGKALRHSQTPSTGTLRPTKKESKDWDTTQNLYIEGDNLEVLKLLQKSYFGRIKMIYIDPPYNTGKDFVYEDDFRDSIKNYKELTGQVDGAGRALSTNPETSGRYHRDWLNMMYSRLRLAKNLLAEDGVIFVSIDDNEVANLRKICDEVFGESNFVGQIIWLKKRKGSFLTKGIVSLTEYLLVYSKNTNSFRGLFGGKADDSESQPLIKRTNNTSVLHIPEETVSTKLTDGVYGKGIYGGEVNPVELLDTVEFRSGVNKNSFRIKGPFIWSQQFLDEELSKGTQLIINTINFQIRAYRIANEDDFKGFGSLINGVTIGGTNEDAYEELERLFGEKKIFDYSKPVNYLKEMINACTYFYRDAIVLDFFSGSATTTHAVFQLNAEDGGTRKCIMVQLPELTAEDSEAYKAGYKNICDIGKERIRRAGELVKKQAIEAWNAADMEQRQQKKNPDELDIGFKVFKLDSTNLIKWNPDRENLEASLLGYVDNLEPGRTEEDLLYEVMLKLGADLTWPIETHKVGTQTIYSVGFGALMVCLSDHITTEVADAMVRLKDEMKPETWKVVFKDSGFADDMAKTNIKETLKCAGLPEDAFTTL